MSPALITLLFLLFAIVMFVTEKLPLGLTSMIVCIGLIVTGVLDVKTAFSGFIDSNVILFVAMFIVGGALFETGMANEIGGLVTKFSKTEKGLIIAIMAIVGVMSGFLSNTGTAAILIPVVVGIAGKSGFKRSRLLMPLVFAAAMGGNLSLIGAPGNMIGQSVLQEATGESFGFFEYAIIGGRFSCWGSSSMRPSASASFRTMTYRRREVHSRREGITARFRGGRSCSRS